MVEVLFHYAELVLFAYVLADQLGVVGVSVVKFALYSVGGALLWAGTWMGIAYAVGDALERVARHINHPPARRRH